MSKLAELENFLLNENSTERKNYEDNILSGKSASIQIIPSDASQLGLS